MAIVDRVGRVIGHDRCVVASAVTAVFVAAFARTSVVALVLLPGYAVLNSLGVRYYCDRLGERHRRLQSALRMLAVVLVPVGLVTSLLTPRRPRPSDAATTGSHDEGIRNAAASTVHGSHYGRGGSP